MTMSIKDNFKCKKDEPLFYAVVDGEFVEKGFLTPEDALVYGTYACSSSNVLVVKRCRLGFIEYGNG